MSTEKAKITESVTKINVADYKTKTEFVKHKNALKSSEKWPIALDIGYSAVKGMSPVSRFRFPSFARPVKNQQEMMTNAYDDSFIEYKDLETGEIWKVGESAYKSLDDNDVADDAQTLYSRYRYSNPMFKVILRTGLAFACMRDGNFVQGKTVVLQTGLPPQYMKDDSKPLIDSLKGTHKFELRHGNGKWKQFNITLKEQNIHIMAQPTGSLLGIAMNNDAGLIKEWKKYFTSKVLVFDAGFGTLDIFELIENTPGSTATFDDCGMKAVFEKTLEDFEKKSAISVPIHVFQNALRLGFIKSKNRETNVARKIKFDNFLSRSSKDTCKKALNKVAAKYDLTDYDYFIITGGCGAAWENLIKTALKGIETMTVLMGNQNDPELPQVYSNVRGYYLKVVNTTATKSKKEEHVSG